MMDIAQVTCPYCLQTMEISIEPDVHGTYVQDCEVCCQPWQLSVHRDIDGELYVNAQRAQ